MTKHTFRSARLLSSLLAIAGVTVGLSLVGSGAVDAQPAPKKVACSATVDYTAGGTVSTYSQSFELTNGGTFVDDRSTTLRAEEFDASRNRNVITMSYFKDVSVFDSIQQTTTLTLVGWQGTESGSSVFYNSAGAHTTDYSISCQRI